VFAYAWSLTRLVQYTLVFEENGYWVASIGGILGAGRAEDA
jgi:hypothetical protein